MHALCLKYIHRPHSSMRGMTSFHVFFSDQTHLANAHYILSRTILHFDCVYISHRVAGYHKYLPWRFSSCTEKEEEGVIKSALIELFRRSLFLFRRNKNKTHWEFLLALERKKLIKNSMVFRKFASTPIHNVNESEKLEYHRGYWYRETCVDCR